MEKAVTLKDGDEVVIRDMTSEDAEASHAFFTSLPPEDRRYLRVDVTQRELVQRRIADAASGRVHRLVVVDDGDIVADGALEIEGHGWGQNVAEIRVIVARPYQRRGLGLLLARELYYLAAARRMDRIVVRMMRPQTGATRIFRKLGFRDEFLIPEHVRDQSGTWQDMIIMRCNLEDLWREIEGVFEVSDWRRSR